MQKNIVVTIDGPSGVGKGTLCQALAEKLGFELLDSGAIYRVLGGEPACVSMTICCS